jgi:phosphoribosyl 1,2-cyclic phosphate phosphodiesterase
VIGCKCDVCMSKDLRDKRFRTAALLESDTTRVLIDCGPDIRQQLLRVPFKRIDGVLLTHEHYDHVGGLDDLRPYCYAFGDLDIYANARTVKNVRHNFPYCFVENPYPGVPSFNLKEVEKHKEFRIGDIPVVAIEVMHGKMPIFGYRFGSMAYITDMRVIADDELAWLKGVDTLVVNALRWKKEHHSHMLVNDAIEFSTRIGAKRTYLIHVTHDIGLYEEANKRLPQGFQIAYDGMEITV